MGALCSLRYSVCVCVLFQLLILSTANISGNETDRLALLEFKSQIIQDPQKVMSSWNESLHFCEWEGITCSRRHQRVRMLRLESKDLVGSISSHIGNLSFMRILTLFNNSLTGEIPQEVGRLFRLETLHLVGNSLDGEIPVNISRCSSLRKLSLSFNNLVGKIPMELGSLSKLVEFDLVSNKLIGRIPPSVGNLTFLETIALIANSLEGSIPSSLGQLTSLKELALNENRLSGMFPPSLFNLSTLEIISIPLNQLSGHIPTEIILPNITTLYFGGNRFSGSIPTSLSNASRLQRVDFGANQFTGKVPTDVGNLNELSLLSLAYNYLGSGKSGDLDFFTSLSNHTNLRVLYIQNNQFGGMLPVSFLNFTYQFAQFRASDNQIYGNIPSQIGKFHDLIILDLRFNFFNGSIPLGIGDLQKLQKLSLGGNQLSGKIPPSIRNMSQLFLLDLSNNSLNGSIVSSLGSHILQTLDLSYNNFTGAIPKHEISLSLRLINLTLAHNSLNGSIPLELGDLENLEYLDVSHNKFSGEIPPTHGDRSSLAFLYFQDNFFHGSIPSSLSNLKGLHVVDLSCNNISGEIPKELEKLPFLKLLNLSFNNLEGEVPTKGVFENASEFSLVGNPKICGGIPKLGLSKCYNQKSRKQSTHLALKVTLGVLIPSFMLLLVIVICMRKKPKAKPPSQLFLGDLTRVSYNDLHKATNAFSSENLIGKGSYGCVYTGILHPNEGPIAVKVLNLLEEGASKSFVAECEALREVRHRNLLKILTVCSSIDFNGNEFKALVFEVMPNGSLESWLHPSSNEQHVPRNLNLFQRLNIAIDVASALKYLHNDCGRPIVHCDLKSSNVLLDGNMIAHVGDFGLARFMSKTKSSNKSNSNETHSVGIKGTIGYIPPEYGMGAKVSTQGDMYSFGILLLEMFTGKRPTDQMFNDGLSLHDISKMALSQNVMDVIDTRLISEETNQESVINSINQIEEVLSSIISIGVACSVELMVDRMDIKTVLKEMESIKEVFPRI